ncbi:flagellar basal body P-ring formation chaperone FlgA [Salidesulfovibrio onnuriiensis]|uniref:flagellar basal body P-ring formation chaperone FlgA n=1 Tax=Salidesulfovibrio onnuriiensis TaxID=2583823 RepID=UPI0011CBF70C|nr:flagellar basal body P-ring formation chaperone FlgA [Salidesulfovibrio onnuriiensis]
MSTLYGLIIGSGKKGRLHAVILGGLACVLLLAMAAQAGTSGQWRIKVRDAVCVEGPVVLLGDIAMPVGDYDQKTWDKLSKTQLWKASQRKGHAVNIPRHKLEGILRYYLGDYVQQCVLPSRMFIQTGGKVLDSQALQREVVAFLTAQGRALGDDVEFKKLALPPNFFFPNRYDTLKLSLPVEMKPGTVRFYMESITPDGKSNRKVAGTVFVNAWVAVPCAARPVNRYEKLTPDKITFIKKNLAYNPELWDGRGGPWRVKRPVGTGQPFRRDNLDPLPTISKGDMVTLVYKNKRIQLTTKAKALEDAHLGQQVTVRNLQSKREIVATVVGADLVRVR